MSNSYVPGSYCSIKQILALAVPAILLNAAAPATTTVQTVLLGRLPHHSRQQVAAFAAVSAVANFMTFVLNFMVDGVSARLGHAAGQHRWRDVATGVRTYPAHTSTLLSEKQ